MKVGLISDTHDNLPNLGAALEVLRAEGVRTILHCGDICGPEIIRTLVNPPAEVSDGTQSNGFDAWISQGNMDRHVGLARVVGEGFGRGRLLWLQKLTLGGYPLAMIHGDNDEVLRGLIASGEYAYVFHGHTHRRRDQVMGRTRVINPGALGGMRRETRSFCILDLAAGKARFVRL